jgi:hypothetical protein
MKLNLKLAGDSKTTTIDLPEGTDVDDLKFKIDKGINFDLTLNGKLTTVVAAHVQAYSFEQTKKSDETAP